MTSVIGIRNRLLNAYGYARHRERAFDEPMPGMIELIGTSFIADEDAILRHPNEEYIERELQWYISQSPYVADLPGETPKIWNEVADRGGRVNSNYGRLVFHEENGQQYFNVLDELRRDRSSRRGTMVYTRPFIHFDATRNGMNDFICTNAVCYFIRDEELHAVVQMRSNDVVFGYPNDVAWQRYVQGQLADDLGAVLGTITWQAASLHVYPRHYHLLEEAARG